MHLKVGEEHIADQGVQGGPCSPVGKYERLGGLQASALWCPVYAEAAHSRRP
jgi:hypothetical protein